MEEVAEVVEARRLGDVREGLVRFFEQIARKVEAYGRHVLRGGRVEDLPKGTCELGRRRLPERREPSKRQVFGWMLVDVGRDALDVVVPFE